MVSTHITLYDDSDISKTNSISSLNMMPSIVKEFSSKSTLKYVITWVSTDTLECAERVVIKLSLLR